MDIFFDNLFDDPEKSEEELHLKCRSCNAEFLLGENETMEICTNCGEDSLLEVENED